MHCQIETLRRCFPPSIRRSLDGLPKTLDETYERILLEIDEEKQVYANRLFQCLAVSIRPLYIEELADLFAVLPNAELTPGFDVSWRPEDPEAFILSSCSTLVTIVNTRDGRIVQFAHFSVKEYLTSERIATLAPVSSFQVLPKPAHTLLARACLGVLLQLDYSTDKTNIEDFPLAQYAARHWVDHACFEDVSSHISDGMDRLLDKDRPHLAAWLWIYNIDDEDHIYYRDIYTVHPKQPDAVPLYYAALCGFRGLVERLLYLHPQDLDAEGGVCGTPLGAALHKGHLDIALFLLEHGASGEKRGKAGQTGLYIASSRGYAEIVRTLIYRGANLNAECNDWDEESNEVERSPLHATSSNGRLGVARVLLEYGANVNHPDSGGRSALHIASRCSTDDFVRLLLNQGANPSALDGSNETALHYASFDGGPGTVRLLLDHGLDVNARSKCGWNPFHDGPDDVESEGWTPLHYAATGRSVEVVQLLLDHGADVNARDNCHWTALHLAACHGFFDVVNTLLGRGANPYSRTIKGNTPFEVTKNVKHCSWVSHQHHSQIMQLSSKHTGESGCGP